jgi:hypothetical protein
VDDNKKPIIELRGNKIGKKDLKQAQMLQLFQVSIEIIKKL